MQKIITFITYNNQLEEALNLYTSVFKDSKIISSQRYGDGGSGEKGTVMTATLEISGQRFYLLNGGSHFTFSNGISLFVDCETQEEVDDLWEKLSANGGEKGRCGWLKDQFGVSWQIIPRALGKLMSGGGDPKKSQRVMQAMMQMNKIIIADLQKAYDG